MLQHRSLYEYHNHSLCITDKVVTYFHAPKISKLMNLVAKKIPTKWYELGIQLEIDIATLNTFTAQTSDSIRLCMMVFDQWKREQKVPFTVWETIISTLEEADENSTAAGIREWLDN